MTRYCVSFDFIVEDNVIIEVVKLDKKDIFKSCHGLIYYICYPDGEVMTGHLSQERCTIFVRNQSVYLAINRKYFEKLGAVPYRIRSVVEYERE